MSTEIEIRVKSWPARIGPAAFLYMFPSLFRADYAKCGADAVAAWRWRWAADCSAAIICCYRRKLCLAKEMWMHIGRSAETKLKYFLHNMTTALKRNLCAEIAELTDTLGIAAATGDLSVINRTIHNDWRINRNLFKANNFVRVHAAVVNGRVDVLQLLLDKQIIEARDFNFACISEETCGSIAKVAVVFNQITVLNWMLNYFRKQTMYNVNTPLLVKFIMQEKQLSALQWALDRNLVSADNWACCGSRMLLDWFARRLPLTAFSFRVGGVQRMVAQCERGGMLTSDERKKLWIDVNWRESALAVIIAGKRCSLRLPPELWELIDEYFI